MVIRIYTDADYQGCMNLLVLDKVLILKGFRKCGDDKIAVAKELGISARSLYDRIYCHGVDGIISSRNYKSLIINELCILEKEYPLVFESCNLSSPSIV